MSTDKKRYDTPAELMRFGPPQPDMTKFTKDEIERLANKPFSYPLMSEHETEVANLKKQIAELEATVTLLNETIRDFNESW